MKQEVGGEKQTLLSKSAEVEVDSGINRAGFKHNDTSIVYSTGQMHNL